jgi:hypothetical protein
MNCDLLLVHARVWFVHDPCVECSWMCSLWKVYYYFINAHNEHSYGVLIYAFVSTAVIHLRVPGFDSLQRQEILCITLPGPAVGRSISRLVQSKTRCSQGQGHLYVITALTLSFRLVSPCACVLFSKELHCILETAVFVRFPGVTTHCGCIFTAQ